MHAVYQDAWAYQLYSDSAAAATGNPLNGMSGAPCIIDGAAIGIIRSNLAVQPPAAVRDLPQIAAGILYACPIATPTLQDRCSSYLRLLDPIRGLPGLPRRELPKEPFRYLRWYGAEHAEVFFGRNRRLRTLYRQITNPETPRVALVYGSAGIGKSSLLEAGLLPRLAWNYEIYAQRRELAEPIAQSFKEIFSSALAGLHTHDTPVLIVLDQIDEAFTRPTLDGNTELTELGQEIRVALNAKPHSVTIVLGFRSDWLANVRSRLSETAVPFSEFYVERFTRAEIEEIVQGVASSRRLKSTYQVTIDRIYRVGSLTICCGIPIRPSAPC